MKQRTYQSIIADIVAETALYCRMRAAAEPCEKHHEVTADMLPFVVEMKKTCAVVAESADARIAELIEELKGLQTQ